MMVVTGASGFLGRAVVAEAVRRGWPVLAVSRRKISAADKMVQMLQVENYSELMPRTGDVLVHLAEPRDVGLADSDGLAHVGAMRDSFAALAARRWDHVVYASSAVVYGDESARPHPASGAIKPRGAYAQAKAKCENVAVAAGGTAARIANVYGPGMASNNVLSDILKQIGKAGALALRDGAPVRDYLWIEDAARGIADAAAARLGGLINFGTGAGTSAGTLARQVLELAGEGGRGVVETAPSGRKSCIVLDVAATRERLGWEPKMPLADGLSALVSAAR